jgi:hypothetical protein
MYKFFTLIFLIFFFQKISFGQETLPKITVTQLGKRVLVSWNNPFPNVTNINVQRSGDSLKNFTTIGSLLDVAPGINGFADTKEFIPSDQYYRLFISFVGGNYLFTASHRPGPDTLNAIPTIEKPAPLVRQNEKNRFIPSSHVFTGSDNNVIISLPDFSKRKYSLKFYQEDGTLLFEIKKVPQNFLILDKANFRHAGLFIFELYDNNIIIERHKIYIPKDGQPMPPRDEDGYPITFR